MNVGIIGCGGIARKLAETINNLNKENIYLYGVASRDYERALNFQNEFQATKAYKSYEDLVKDEKIDLVYIATPHSHHYKHAMLALENKKAVLCEKAFTVNSKEAKALINYAKKNQLLLGEAIWTRYMPSRVLINEIIESGILGKVSSLSANLGYVINKVPRLIDPMLAGGALLDVGVYPVNFALMVFGDKIKKIETSCTFTDLGVDETDSITFYYEDNKVAHLHATMLARTDRRGYVYGDKGYLEVDNINNPLVLKVYDEAYNLVKEVRVPKQINGYEYELLEMKDCLEKGLIEPKSMPFKDTLRVMEILDSIRKRWGLKYPFEV